MVDESKSKEQLQQEVERLRQRVSELEASEEQGKQAEEALRESEERYRTLVESAPEGIFVTNAAGSYIEVNAAACAMTGYSRDELLKMSVQQLVSPNTSPESRGTFGRVVEAGRGEADIVLRHKSGTDVHVALKAVVLDADRIIAFCPDITERKLAEKALGNQERYYRSLIHSLHENILVIDQDHRVTDINSRALASTGLKREEVLGRSCFEVLHRNNRPCGELGEECPFQKVLETGKPATCEHIHRHADGTMHHAAIQMSPLLDVEGNVSHVIEAARDVSDLFEAHEKQAALQEQLQQSQKMESIGRLAGGVAHDFNNILTGINGYSEMIIDDLEPGDPMRADLQEIKAAGERAAGLTRQLLAFSRKQTISPKVVCPNDILESSQQMLRRIIGEDIDLEFIPAKDLGRIKADPAQLDQILVNLAVNAREATPDGGKLTIETQNVSLDEEFCASHVEAEPGDHIMLAVSDNGQGMDEKTKSKIFEPFFSSKGSDANTGLGLATVYGIVKQNGGFISVYSELDAGTTFKVYFPRVKKTADALPEERPRDTHTGTETVLLVEDEALVRNLAKRILEKSGYNVIAKDNGGAAFVYCDQSDDPIDLLLTDVVMPNMNGRDLFTKLQKKRPALKALFMSGYTENVIAHHGVLDEGVRFIQKPFTIETLETNVRRVLDEKE